MKNLISSLIVLFILNCVYAQEKKFVLVIGIDGCRPDALEVANTPNLDQLIENGFFSPNALNDDITVSGPGWSAILCGTRSDKHLVTNNDFSNNNYDEFPSVFKHIKTVRPEFQTVSFCHWSPINTFIIGDDADFKLNFGSDSELAETAADYLKINDPELCFLHFDDVDHAGHSYGFSPSTAEYITSIEQTDIYLGVVLDAIRSRSNYDNEDWLIVSTTDHGGVGFGHGGTSLEHREVFMISSGKYIETLLITSDSTYFSDDTFHCLGDSVSLSFKNNNAQLSSFDDRFNFGEEQDFTIECRVKTNNAADVAIIGNKDWDTGLNPGFVFSFKYASGPEWKVNIGDGNSRVDLETGGLVADDEWHLLTVSFDRDGMMRMYEDGAYIGEVDISGIGNINTNGGIFAGSDLNLGYDFDGNISEIRIWDALLDENTILQNQCEKINEDHPNYNNLLAYWELNQDLGNQVSSSGPIDIVAELNLTEWESKDSMLIISHESTPRLVDVVPTILEHLCIPVQAEWQLEGKSLIEENCSSSTIGLTDLIISISPNPFTNMVKIGTANDQLKELRLYDQFGNSILKKTIRKIGHLDLSGFSSGVYFISLRTQDGFKTQTHRVVKLD